MKWSTFTPVAEFIRITINVSITVAVSRVGARWFDLYLEKMFAVGNLAFPYRSICHAFKFVIAFLFES